MVKYLKKWNTKNKSYLISSVLIEANLFNIYIKIFKLYFSPLEKNKITDEVLFIRWYKIWIQGFMVLSFSSFYLGLKSVYGENIHTKVYFSPFTLNSKP